MQHFKGFTHNELWQQFNSMKDQSDWRMAFTVNGVTAEDLPRVIVAIELIHRCAAVVVYENSAYTVHSKGA